MSISIAHFIRSMRGGAQSKLMLGADGYAYVVKFRNNPQCTKVLANEFLASRLARDVGLSAQETEIVEVPAWLTDTTPDLEMEFGKTKEPCKPGLHCGAKYAGGLMPGLVADYLSEKAMNQVRNLDEFAGILAFDKWTSNADGRQAVFVKSSRASRHRAIFIDFGYCFQADQWTFDDNPLRGVYHQKSVYREIRGWESFEPWLTSLENIDPGRVWTLATEIPRDWYGGTISELEELVDRLLARRAKIRELIVAFGRSDPRPFPNWELTCRW